MRGVPVLINDQHLEHRDYSGTAAAGSKIRQLLTAGAISWRHINDLMTELIRR